MNPELLKKYKKVKCKPNEKIKKGDILALEYKTGHIQRFYDDCKRTAFIVGGINEYGNYNLRTLDKKGGMNAKEDDGVWTHSIDKDRRFVYKLKLLPKKKKKISNRDSSYLRLKDLIL